VVLAALLVAGGGYWLFIVQAQAAIASPASLILIAAPVNVGANGAVASRCRPYQPISWSTGCTRATVHDGATMVIEGHR
jgi:hypothetical protein